MSEDTSAFDISIIQHFDVSKNLTLWKKVGGGGHSDVHEGWLETDEKVGHPIVFNGDFVLTNDRVTSCRHKRASLVFTRAEGSLPKGCVRSIVTDWNRAIVNSRSLAFLPGGQNMESIDTYLHSSISRLLHRPWRHSPSRLTLV
ncbi:hypothetical protein FRC03_005147 [Tulasnella sp. 419]|nr:hypothetical protein FRC03_005147 [Tulasnella sp. 419]